jgi:hypothetical protein
MTTDKSNSPGGDVDIDDDRLPPYDGRTKGGEDATAERREAVKQMLAETKTHNDGATSSPAVEDPVQADEVTDREPETPLGVGESVGRRGEKNAKREDEAGRDEDGTQGATQRPVGTSTSRDHTGVAPDRSESKTGTNSPGGGGSAS